jgi:hypothetical protein
MRSMTRVLAIASTGSVGTGTPWRTAATKARSWWS